MGNPEDRNESILVCIETFSSQQNATIGVLERRVLIYLKTYNHIIITIWAYMNTFLLLLSIMSKTKILSSSRRAHVCGLRFPSHSLVFAEKTEE